MLGRVNVCQYTQLGPIVVDPAGLQQYCPADTARYDRLRRVSYLATVFDYMPCVLSDGAAFADRATFSSFQISRLARSEIQPVSRNHQTFH